jgi:hypothetical protein
LPLSQERNKMAHTDHDMRCDYLRCSWRIDQNPKYCLQDGLWPLISPMPSDIDCKRRWDLIQSWRCGTRIDLSAVMRDQRKCCGMKINWQLSLGNIQQ